MQSFSNLWVNVSITLLVVVGACKSQIRQEPVFEPRLATEGSGKLVARQVVLMTSSDDNEVEKRLKNDPQLEERLHKILITRGGEHPIIDKLRSFFTIPLKLIFWNRSVGSGELHEDAEIAIKLALEDGGASETHVSINEYNPKLIWQRTFQNDKTSFLSKVTLGTATALIYTVVPQRLFYGVGEHYNPFADTIVLYSDNLDLALHEAGHAIDFSEKHKKGIGAGLYSLGRLLFPIKLYQEAVANGKAFQFLKEHGTSEDVASSYALLFPAFGTYLAGAIFTSNKLISKIKIARGREATRLSKWLNNVADAMSKWRASRTHGGRITSSSKAMKFAVVIPVIVAAHIVGRVMGAFVKTPYEKPINPKLK